MDEGVDGNTPDRITVAHAKAKGHSVHIPLTRTLQYYLKTVW